MNRVKRSYYLKVCVLIPTWKRIDKLKIALRSLGNQSDLPDRVIVVSRDIDDETNSWIKSHDHTFKFSFSHYLVDIPGVIAAENLGLSHITEDIVAFLDDDAEAPPDWVATIRKNLADPGVMAIGGPDYIVHEKLRDYPKFCDDVGLLTFYGKVIGNHHQLTKGVREVQVLKGVNMAFKREGLPLLDERLASEHHLGNGSQWELDLCLSMAHRGKLLFLPDLRVNHFSHHGHFNILENQRNNAHNIVYVMMKHFSLVRQITFLFYISLIGNHQNIGILKALSLIPKHGLKRSLELFISSCVGGFFGLKTYLGAKRL